MGPTFEFFERTHAFIISLQKLGCRTERLEAAEPAEENELHSHHRFLQRGYTDKVERCKGRIKFSYDFEGNPFLKYAFHVSLFTLSPRCRCEHFNGAENRSHYAQHIDGNYYDVAYLEAFFTGDVDEAYRIEFEALESGHGPLAECNTITNTSSQRRNCRKCYNYFVFVNSKFLSAFAHRHDDGSLKQPLVVQRKCGVKYQVFVPLEAYRAQCPRIFLWFHGEHTHPAPFQLTTPSRIRADIVEILTNMREDLVDITPRGLLRHASLRRYVQRNFPEDPTATLADVHVSLANRAHLGMYIDQVKLELYPHGSGWKGVFIVDGSSRELIQAKGHCISIK